MPRISKATTKGRTTANPIAAVRQEQASVEEAAPVAAKSDGRAGRGVVRDKVLKYIERASGTTVYIDDMARDLGIEPASIRGAVRGLIDSGNCPQLIPTIAGRAWRWDASAKANGGKRIFEELTTTKAGIVLVQDEDGNVYKLEEL